MGAAFLKNSDPKATGAKRSKIATNTAPPHCGRRLSFYREAPPYSAVYEQPRQFPPAPSMRRRHLAWLICVSLLSGLGLVACGADPTPNTASAKSAANPEQQTQQNVQQATTNSNAIEQDALTVLIFGDSISAAYGIEREDGWVALLQTRLTSSYPTARAINASVSGETTQGGRARLQAALTRHSPELVYLELGGNDALRGYPVSKMTDNLKAMVTMAQNSGARVVLLGMQIPPNYGPRYTRDFADAFTKVATATGAHLVPFFLEGVALEDNMIQSDGIHPTTLAQPILLTTGWQALVAILGDDYPALASAAP